MNVHELREKARKLRLRAVTVTDLEAQKALLDLAVSYDKSADITEAKENAQPPMVSR